MNRPITLSMVAALITASTTVPLVAQTGVVFLNGNSVADNGGPFLGLGVTYMSALYWARNDRNLLDGDLAYLASKEFKYIRILSEVPGGCGEFWDNRGIHPVNYTSSGGCFQPAWADYTAQLQYLLDRAYDTFGMRTEITIFGGAGASMPAKSTRQQHLDRILNAVAGREHKVMMIEVANESWQNGFPGSQGQADVREFGLYLAQRTPVLIALSSPQDTSNAGITSMYGASAADIATVHFSRDLGPAGGWEPVYDCYRTGLTGIPPMSSNEPIGPGSSVSSETDPIRLVMAAAFAWGANLPMYVYHTNAGVRRDQTFQSMAASDAYVYLNDLLPSDFVNWTRHDGKESASPFTNFANGQANKWWPEVGSPTSGAVRNTGKNNGSQFITLPIGILSGGLQVQARRSVSFNAYNPLNNTAVYGATLNTNGSTTIPQGPRGYIVKGIFPDLVSVVTVDLDSVDIERGIDHIVCCDGNTIPWNIGGRNARVNSTANDHYMYFNVGDGFTFQGNKPNLTITIDYFDYTTNTLTLNYDATSTPYKVGPTIQFTNTQTWKQIVWQVTDAYFGNRENGGSDFRLFYSGLDFYIDVVKVEVSPTQSPFGGTPWGIPGTIQAENFDNGGQSVAYNDLSAGNSGGQYRSTDVDVEGTSDTGGGYNVGFIDAGEWLEYTVNVASAGMYEVRMRVTSCCSGGAFHVEMNGQNVTGAQNFAATGGWQTWTTKVVSGVTLSAGQQIMRIVMDAGGWNFNHVEITQPQTPFGGTPRAIPGTIQVEDFDNGGEGVAYHDLDASNNGGQYRTTGVDIEACSDTGGGFNTGWGGAGEWLEYTVNVANTGDHTFKLRFASCCAPAAFHLEMNGQNVSGYRVVDATDGWQTWTTILVPACFLTADNNQILRYYDETGDPNLNKIDVTYGGADAVHVDLDATVLQDGMTHPQPADGDTQGAAIGGHFCRRNVNNTQDFYYYFAVFDAYAFQGNRPNLWISFDYYDTGTGSLSLQYDATSSAYKSGPSVTLTNTNTWKSVAWNVTDAYFGNRQNNGADFRIFRGTNQTFYIDTVQVSLLQP